MEQQTLRELENRCIQEEPPPCTAACPLHVDARALSKHAAAGRWDRALAVLHKTMPLTGVLGRICDAPCTAVCNRRDAGGAIRIAALERAVVGCADSPPRVMPLPSKGVSVAVVGAGLSSLTVAWDLVRKGYAVTVFEPRGDIGGGLLRRHAPRVTAEQIAAETGRLGKLGVRFETSRALGSRDDRRHCLETFDAVYVGLDDVPSDPWPLTAAKDRARRGYTGTAGRDHLFAAGDHPSPVWQAAQGRWAATSMDRRLQRVSLEAGRDREGPHETRLFTSLAGVAPLPPVAAADPQMGFDRAEAAAEASRCLQCQCLECVKVCAYLESFGSYPRRYAREIYNNEAIVMGERKANRLINSCSLCGLCEAVCPNDFAMQDLCLQARRRMVDRGRMPPSAHDFALQDMAFSLGERFAAARHAPGRTASRFLFFPGCQLCASAPRQVARVYDHLRNAWAEDVGLMLGCCGAPAHWAGRRDLFSRLRSHWRKTWDDMGRPRPVMACSTCLRIFREQLPDTGALSLWEVLAETEIPETPSFRVRAPLVVHDPCTARDTPAVREAVRRLLSRLGVDTEEPDLGGDLTECCGFGGLMFHANPVLAREVARRRGERSGGDFLAYCAMCRDSLAAVGKRTLHLLDLLFPDPAVPDAAARPRPGWSRRRENRIRLRERLGRTLWGETAGNGAGEAAAALHMTPEVAALVESRRILEEDIRAVVRHAESGGPRFTHRETNHRLGFFRCGHATFWVSYTPAADGFTIHNAYAHRMEVIGP